MKVSKSSSGQAEAADLTALSSCETGGAAALAALTATEIEILDGATLSTAELNYVDGVTSAIQTQIDSKSPVAGSSSIVTTGALNAGSITGGFGNIDVGSSTIDTTGAVGTGPITTALSTATGILIDQDYSDTDATTIACLDIDLDKTGASVSANTIYGIRCDLDNTTATNGANAMTGIKVTPTLSHAADNGSTIIKGVEVVATGAGPSTSTARALDLTATGADYNQGIYCKVADGGPDLKMVSSADVGDYATISVGANGATTIATVDDDSANAADLSFSVQGSFDVTAATSVSFAADVTVTGDVTATGGDLTLGTAADSADTTIKAADESGTDTAGKKLSIQGGLGTGNAAPGAVEISVGLPAGSGSSVQSAALAIKATAEGPSTYYGGTASLANDSGVGEIVIFGTEDGTDSLAAGRLMVLNSSGVWKYADADAEATTSNLLAIALGTAVSDGLLVKGYFKLNSYIEGSFAKGAPCYVSEAAGEVDFTRPSAAGDFVRVLGYGTDTTGVIMFDPSGTWIEL